MSLLPKLAFVSFYFTLPVCIRTFCLLICSLSTSCILSINLVSAYITSVFCTCVAYDLLPTVTTTSSFQACHACTLSHTIHSISFFRQARFEQVVRHVGFFPGIAVVAERIQMAFETYGITDESTYRQCIRMQSLNSMCFVFPGRINSIRDVAFQIDESSHPRCTVTYSLNRACSSFRRLGNRPRTLDPHAHPFSFEFAAPPVPASWSNAAVWQVSNLLRLRIMHPTCNVSFTAEPVDVLHVGSTTNLIIPTSNKLRALRAKQLVSAAKSSQQVD